MNHICGEKDSFPITMSTASASNNHIDVDNAISLIENLSIDDDKHQSTTTFNNKVKTIVDRSYESMNKIMDKWCEDYDSNFSGGKMRGCRGEHIEQFVREVVFSIKHVFDVDVTAIKGDKDKKTLTLQHDGSPLTKDHQVDIHIYRDGVFVSAIECKAYLDSCYYVRACDDFRLFDKFEYNIKKYVFALENSIDQKTKAFTDIITDNTCDNIFYILDGKRVSTKPVYMKQFRKPINRDRLADFVKTMVHDLVQ